MLVVSIDSRGERGGRIVGIRLAIIVSVRAQIVANEIDGELKCGQEADQADQPANASTRKPHLGHLEMPAQIHARV